MAQDVEGELDVATGRSPGPAKVNPTSTDDKDGPREHDSTRHQAPSSGGGKFATVFLLFVVFTLDMDHGSPFPIPILCGNTLSGARASYPPPVVKGRIARTYTKANTSS